MSSSNLDSPSEPADGRSAHLELGRRGEELAAAYLKQLGYNIVAANFTLPVGRNLRGAVVNAEIDLVAYEGPTLCFVEVKTRASDWFAPPQVNVDLRKRRQIVRAARTYRRMLGLEASPYRYDVVNVILPAEAQGPSQIELLRDFWTEESLRKRRWIQSDYYY
ncbi:MAG: YraN family protein [Pyrinomonadaceae bacterium]|nr:YraN family protein [Pyrinomonadaceae bacterium]